MVGKKNVHKVLSSAGVESHSLSCWLWVFCFTSISCWDRTQWELVGIVCSRKGIPAHAGFEASPELQMIFHLWEMRTPTSWWVLHSVEFVGWSLTGGCQGFSGLVEFMLFRVRSLWLLQNLRRSLFISGHVV